MKISYDSAEKSILVVRPEGKLDITSMMEFKTYFDELVKHNPHSSIIVDLSKVEYITSSCLGIIVSKYRELHYNQVNFAICNAQGICEKIIDAINLKAIIPIYDNERSAVTDLKYN